MLGLAKELIYFPGPLDFFEVTLGFLGFVKSADDWDEGAKKRAAGWAGWKMLEHMKKQATFFPASIHKNTQTYTHTLTGIVVVTVIQAGGLTGSHVSPTSPGRVPWVAEPRTPERGPPTHTHRHTQAFSLACFTAHPSKQDHPILLAAFGLGQVNPPLPPPGDTEGADWWIGKPVPKCVWILYARGVCSIRATSVTVLSNSSILPFICPWVFLEPSSSLYSSSLRTPLLFSLESSSSAAASSQHLGWAHVVAATAS